MMRLPYFAFHAPRTVGEAADLLAAHGSEAMLVAGGTDLLPNMSRSLLLAAPSVPSPKATPAARYLPTGAAPLASFMWIRKGIDETPMFERLEQTGAKAARPIGEVVRHHWRRLLIAGGVRIGSDVFYALVFVFTLTYVTSVLKLSRTLALTAIAIATPFNAIGILWLSGLSDRVGRRPVYAAGAVAGM